METMIQINAFNVMQIVTLVKIHLNTVQNAHLNQVLFIQKTTLVLNNAQSVNMMMMESVKTALIVAILAKMIQIYVLAAILNYFYHLKNAQILVLMDIMVTKKINVKFVIQIAVCAKALQLHVLLVIQEVMFNQTQLVIQAVLIIISKIQKLQFVMPAPQVV